MVFKNWVKIYKPRLVMARVRYSIRKISEKKNTEVASLTPVSDKIEYEVYAKKLAFMN